MEKESRKKEEEEESLGLSEILGVLESWRKKNGEGFGGEGAREFERG